MNLKVKRLQEAAARAQGHSKALGDEAAKADNARREAEALLSEPARLALYTRLQNKPAFEAEMSKRIAALDAARTRATEARRAAEAALEAWSAAGSLARACEEEAARAAKEANRPADAEQRREAERARKASQEQATAQLRAVERVQKQSQEKVREMIYREDEVQ